MADHKRSITIEIVADDDFGLDLKKTATITAQRIERALIMRALIHCGGNRRQAAKLLRISYRTILYKIKGYDIDVEFLTPRAIKKLQKETAFDREVYAEWTKDDCNAETLIVDREIALNRLTRIITNARFRNGSGHAI